MIFGSPKKHVTNSIKKIGKGRGNQKAVMSLNKTLTEHPELREGAVYQLVRIIQTNKVESFSYAIEVLLNIAEVEPDLLANSSDAIIRILEFPEDSLDINYMLKTMEILGMIASRYPELMQPSVMTLLQKLNSSNSQIRAASFYILDIIAKTHPIYLSGYTFDLLRSFYSSYDDERLYATRLIIKIAMVSHTSFDAFCEVLNNLVHKEPDLKLMQEAYNALRMSEPGEEPIEFKDEIIPESDDFGELVDVMAENIKGIDFEKDARELLKSFGMEHLIVKPPDKKLHRSKE